MLLVNSSQYYNLLALIFVSHLYGIDYLPFNQPSTKFEKNYKIGIIVRITFSDTETTLLQKQQLYMIQSLSYKKLSGSKQQLDFQIFTKFLKNGKFSLGWAA